MNRRQWNWNALAATALFAVAGSAWAQGYPTRTIEQVVAKQKLRLD